MAKLARLAKHYAKELKDVTSIPAQGRGLIFLPGIEKGSFSIDDDDGFEKFLFQLISSLRGE